ncbi:MAG TPA: MFS transporter [Bacteroidales bacterium]|nr:MFS transporter [Bacteroidales bacterium]HSA44472.1 MFS transporter [Bacteroidales bacterium]
MKAAKKGSARQFGKSFWTVITMEFFERGSYYGVMSVLSVYLVLSKAEGGLNFPKESVGVIKSVITPLLYFLPILAGAIGDRFGYRKILFLAFSLMSLGYLFAGFSTTYATVFGSLLLMAFGAGFFKPLISGTIARVTDHSNASLGFGIYYWSINLGAFLFPLILVPWLKSISFNYIFFMAAIGTGSMLLLNLLVFKEPVLQKTIKPLRQVFREMVMVLGDYRFIVMIVLYSGFWIMYFQVYDSVLWYLKEKVDMSGFDRLVNSVLALFMEHPSWKFDAEHVTVMNAGAIILLQLLVSGIVRNKKALPTMIFGIALGSAGMGMLAISPSGWIFLLSMFVFTLGEMIAHPKFISYVGMTAPADKKALYQGYAFLYGVIGSGVGGILGAHLYVLFVEKLNQPSLLWITFSGIGVLTIIGLLVYNRVFGRSGKN